MKKNIRVLFLFDSPFFAERDHDFTDTFKDPDWKTEAVLYKTLLANGCDVKCLGIYDDISILVDELKEKMYDVVLCFTEVFNEKRHLEKNIVWLVEMLDIPYTGASPSILHICSNKALTKQLLSFHKIKVPNFYVFSKGRKIWLPKRLKIPLIVKPLREEASKGIAQASIVDNESSLIERVKFIHERINADAIVEEYVEGRELYIGMLGNKKIHAFPPVEMKFGNELEDEARIATYKAKWDDKYRKRWGIKNVLVGKLPEGINKRIEDICKRAYRALDIKSYARFDIRLSPDGKIHILEVNANPNLAKDEDFALAADKYGFSYNVLIKKIISLAFKR